MSGRRLGGDVAVLGHGLLLPADLVVDCVYLLVKRSAGLNFRIEETRERGHAIQVGGDIADLGRNREKGFDER